MANVERQMPAHVQAAYEDAVNNVMEAMLTPVCWPIACLLVGSFSLTTLSGFVDLRNRTVCNAISWRVRRSLPAPWIGRAPEVTTIYPRRCARFWGLHFADCAMRSV